jgi:hypothetical protein
MAAERHNLTRRALLGAGAVATAAAVAGTSQAVEAARVEADAPASPAPAPAHDSVEMVCRSCGGTAVTRDAWAEWDAAGQQWVLGSVFDYAYCHDCDEETQIEEVDLASLEPSTG